MNPVGSAPPDGGDIQRARARGGRELGRGAAALQIHKQTMG